MFEIIEKLRSKPDRVKKQIAFGISFLLAGIIFVVWLSVIYPDFKRKQDRENLALAGEHNPISSVGDVASSGFMGIMDQFSKIKEVFSSFSGSPTYYSATDTSNSVVTEEQIIH